MIFLNAIYDEFHQCDIQTIFKIINNISDINNNINEKNCLKFDQQTFIYKVKNIK